MTPDQIRSMILNTIATPENVHRADLASMVSEMEAPFSELDRSTPLDEDNLGVFWEIVHRNDRRGRKCRSGECGHFRNRQICYA